MSLLEKESTEGMPSWDQPTPRFVVRQACVESAMQFKNRYLPKITRGETQQGNLTVGE